MEKFNHENHKKHEDLIEIDIGDLSLCDVKSLKYLRDFFDIYNKINYRYYLKPTKDFKENNLNIDISFIFRSNSYRIKAITMASNRRYNFAFNIYRDSEMIVERDESKILRELESFLGFRR